jgi:hypothetical protein
VDKSLSADLDLTAKVTMLTIFSSASNVAESDTLVNTFIGESGLKQLKNSSWWEMMINNIPFDALLHCCCQYWLGWR